MSAPAIDQRLRDLYDQLTPRERLIADFVLAHPEDLALFNTAELARMCGVSKATVSRLFRRLGFSSFKEGKAMARTLRYQGVPVTDARAGTVAFDTHLRQEQHNLQQLFQMLDRAEIDALIGALARAREIVIIGFRNSYPVALHLRQQLIQVRGRVRLAPQPGQSLAEELSGLEAQDLVILFGFRRRPRLFDTLLQHLKNRDLPLLLIADHSLAAHSGDADWWLECPLDSRSAFDSYASAMCLVTLLANRLLHHGLEQGRERIARISHEYAALEELSLAPLPAGES